MIFSRIPTDPSPSGTASTTDNQLAAMFLVQAQEGALYVAGYGLGTAIVSFPAGSDHPGSYCWTAFARSPVVQKLVRLRMAADVPCGR